MLGWKILLSEAKRGDELRLFAEVDHHTPYGDELRQRGEIRFDTESDNAGDDTSLFVEVDH